MLRIRALNQLSSDESEGEEEIPSVTREAQEHNAFSQYKTALSLLADKKTTEAQKILKDLLQGDVLSEVNGRDSPSHPLVVLKYSCLTNMGAILVQHKDYEGARDHFLEASRLDYGDVRLWFQLGCVAMKLDDYNLARDAFFDGLQQSPKNWLCIDKLVYVLYVLEDYLTCLRFISHIFKWDPNYLIGLTIRDAIFKEYPNFMSECIGLLDNVNLGTGEEKYNQQLAQQVMLEVKQLKAARYNKLHRDRESLASKPLEPSYLDKSLSAMSWDALGKSLIHQLGIQKQRLLSPLKLLQSVGNKESNSATVIEPDESIDAMVETTEKNTEQNNSKYVDNNFFGQMDKQVEETMQLNTNPQESEETKSRKRRRNSMSFLAQWVWGGKRRSARVRSTVRREAEREECNVEEALRRILPPSLLPSPLKDEKPKDSDLIRTNDDSMDTMDLYKLFEHREAAECHGEDKNPDKKSLENESVLKEEGYFSTDREKSDVECFLQQNNNSDIISILENFLTELSSRWQFSWPKELIHTYLKTYKLTRQYIFHPDIFGPKETHTQIKRDALMTILYEELSLDCWLQEQFGDGKSERSSQQPVLSENIGFLELVFHYFQADCEYKTRLLWLKAHLYINNGELENAGGYLKSLLNHLQCDDEGMKSIFRLKNCSYNNIISKESVQNLVTILFRNQNLSEIEFLFEEKRYKELVEILQETFNYCQQPGLCYNNSNSDSPHRATQLIMLLDALWQLKSYQDCFHWGEACCNEALHKYLSSEEDERQKWASTLEKLLEGMESCVQKAGLSVVDVPRLSRLVQNLTHIVCHQIESPDTIISMPIESVNPWILLQQILQWEEEKGTVVPSEGEDDLPAYISILFTAHDFLSRRSWCCSNEGALLLHTMDVIIPRMDNSELQGVHDKLVQGMEQVFYCLYAHPSKKTKIRGSLQDHGVPPVRLTWEHSLKLYQFYLPRELPGFDSYSCSSITADIEVLLKRIITLIPPQSNPVLMRPKMKEFIEGKELVVPSHPEGYTPLPRQIAAIYYLLGDFYFKNNDWVKAIHHYLLDVCVNPFRLDSWAGMGLARGSLLETKLNSCMVLKSESQFLNEAICAHRCFQKALEIDPKQSLLWIEHGSFVYTMHSFCSRLLKQETDSLNLEKFSILENQKEEMLAASVRCFTNANKVWYDAGENSGLQDERWLHHYMLGKAAEKDNLEPRVYLDHYSKASHFLHINGASYARKISYNNPPNLAVEALEVFYRIHASILKWLEQNEGKTLDHDKHNLFQKFLQEAQMGPFMTRQSIEGRPDSDEDKSKRPFEPIDDFWNTKQPSIDQPIALKNQTQEPKNSKLIPSRTSKNPKIQKSSPSKDSRLSDTVIELLDDLLGQVAENLVEMLPEDSQDKVDKTKKLAVRKRSRNEGTKVAEEEKRGTKQTNQCSTNECDKSGTAQVHFPKLSSDLKHISDSVRRTSQESSTSVTTETSGKSSSSENESSSSDNSSESFSCSSSDSSSADTGVSHSNECGGGANGAKKKGKEDVDTNMKTKSVDSVIGVVSEESDWRKVYGDLVQRCLVGLEECVLRFPQHYKALYRLTHYYFHSENQQDYVKCRNLLLGNYVCQPLPGRAAGASFQGLFVERRTNNFFNGVWRIPVPEIDRPGCFASHMSRCILLLMDVLLELRDHNMLLEMFLQLRRTPDADKKYLRDSEREQLSRQALSLAVQTMRTKIQDKKESKERVLLDAYGMYQKVQKNYPQKEFMFAVLLQDAYKNYLKVDHVELEKVLQYCNHKLAAARAAATTPVLPPVSTVPASQGEQHNVSVSSGCLPNTSIEAPSQVSSSTQNRPRGRSPTTCKPVTTEEALPRASIRTSPNWSSNLPKPFQQQTEASSLPSLPLNFLNSMFHDPCSLFSDPKILTAAMKTKSSTIDPQVALGMLQAQMSGYQAEILRQISVGSMGSYSQMPTNFGLGSTSFYNHPNVLSSKNHPSSASLVVSDYVKDRPNISITPIPHSSIKQIPKSTSSLNSGQSSSTISIKPQSQEKSTPHPSSSIDVSLMNSKLQDSEHSATPAHKNKEGLFTGILGQCPRLSVAQPPVINTSPKGSSFKKDSVFKAPRFLENPSNSPQHTPSVEPRHFANKSDLKPALLKRCQTDIQELSNKTSLDSCSNKEEPHNQGSSLHVIHMNTNPPASSQGASQFSGPLHSSTKSQMKPYTALDMPLTMQPVSPSYKQSTPHHTESMLTKKEEKSVCGENYSPPAKKPKDSISIVEISELKDLGKKLQGFVKKEEPKVSVTDDVEVITLE